MIFYSSIIIKSKYTKGLWDKKIILITIKVIFHHQVRQERVTFFFLWEMKETYEKWEQI